MSRDHQNKDSDSAINVINDAEKSLLPDCIQITDSTMNSLSAECANENISCHNDTQSADFTDNTFPSLSQQQSIDNMPSDLMTNNHQNCLLMRI